MRRKQPTTPNTKSGFTIVEISLATALLSVLLIAISVIIINITNIYQKGTTVKSLNSVGRNLVDDITNSIESAIPAKLISWSSEENSYLRTSDNGGAVCLGRYSYLWAKPLSESDTTAASLVYNGPNSPKNNVRLLKIRDPERQVCINYQNSGTTTDIRSLGNYGVSYTISDEPEELLTSNDIDLYLYDFTINRIDGSSNLNQANGNIGEVFFHGSFTLGTKRGVNYDAVLSNCNVGSADTEDEFNYCAVNKFKFAARTAGKVGTS